MPGQWLSDGSPEISVSADGLQVACSLDVNVGNVFNAIFKDGEEGVSSGSHYWQIHLSELERSAIFIGLTDTEKFQNGWGVKGLLYGGPGNLSNGGTLLQSGFGPAMKSNTTVGIVAIFDGNQLKIYFDVDCKPLGLAYDVSSSILNGVFPVVHFSGNGKATISKLTEIPSDLTWKEPVYEGIEGKWKCSTFKNQPPVKSVTVDITKSEKKENSYKFQLRVINSIGYTGVKQDGRWRISGGRSTKKGGPLEHMKLEHDISVVFRHLSRVEVEDSTLVVAKDTIEAKWNRYTVPRSPVTQNPF